MRTPTVLAVAVALLAACTGGADPPGARQASPALPSPQVSPTAAADVVDLTIYLRAGQGQHAHLEAVTRTVPVGDDLPRAAVELLLAGPDDDERGLDAPLPATTRVDALTVQAGVAHVELSAEAVRDAGTVGGQSPANEALALAALVNTLTEFPSIDAVRARVVGDGGRFWGHWGMPPVLVRDETLIGARPGGERLVDLARFSSGAQSIGAERVAEVDVTAVRVRDRLTYVRVVVELASPDEAGGASKVPRTRGQIMGDRLVVDVSQVASYTASFGEHQALELTDDAFEEIRVEHDGERLRLALHLDEARDHPFWLHSLSNPTRVVIDVKK